MLKIGWKHKFSIATAAVLNNCTFYDLYSLNLPWFEWKFPYFPKYAFEYRNCTQKSFNFHTLIVDSIARAQKDLHSDMKPKKRFNLWKTKLFA